MRTKGNLMYRLLKTYSIALLIVITLFSIIIGLVISKDNEKRAINLNQTALNTVVSFVEQNQKKATQLADKIKDMEAKYQGLTAFFTMDEPEYLAYTLKNDLTQSSVPYTIKCLYYTYDDIESVAIDFETSKDRYYSTKDNKYGKKVKKIPHTSGIKFNQTFNYSLTERIAGNLYLTVDQTALKSRLEQMSNKYTTNLFVISERNQLVFTNSHNQTLIQEIENNLKKGKNVQLSELEKNNFVDSSKINTYQVISLINKQEVSRNSRTFLIGILLFSACVEILLLYLLYRLFNGYLHQVDDILVSVNKVSNGERNTRLTLEDKKAELKDISKGINEMLESLDTFIKENYELELKQKDAEFRALQAQINPHFMYNTLEYIRMYALSEGMVELSEVVFAFASILRNNISHEKMISIENEMKFIEQYVYLYQMRYPKNIAYSFQIDETVKEYKVPKFCLQPLVENYFAHGIDYTRMNNVISVYARLINNSIEITIRDNGKGISSNEREKINAYLKNEGEYPTNSIGIRNVYERLKLNFEKNCQMYYEETIGGGTTVRIIICLGGEE